MTALSRRFTENRHMPPPEITPDTLASMLAAHDSSDRLQAALTAGTYPRDTFAEPLVARSAVEEDFYVRDMLTWALTRISRDVALPLVLAALDSQVPQARSQALHTLSKFAEPHTWHAIHTNHLHDADDEVARAAWRTAVGLVPFEHAEQLAAELVEELGRGNLDVHRSLSRALAEIDVVATPLLEQVASDDTAAPGVRTHAQATLRLIDDPEATFVLE